MKPAAPVTRMVLLGKIGVFIGVYYSIFWGKRKGEKRTCYSNRVRDECLKI